MKIYRYMSKVEFNKMMSGKSIVGKKHHVAMTNSTGICFLPETVTFIVKDGRKISFDPVLCFDFLYGIVADDYLVEFETNESLNCTYGRYADPTTENFGDFITVQELCIPEYNKLIVKPIRYSNGYDFCYNYHKGINALNWIEIE